MADVLRRPQQGAYHAARQIPSTAGARRGRHRRGSELQDYAAQLLRDMRRSYRLPEGQGVPPLPRLPHWRQHRRVQIQRRSARRQHQGARQDREARPQDTRHPRHTILQDIRDAHRLHHESRGERQDKGAKSGGPHRRQRGDSRSPRPRCFVRQDPRRTLRLHRLRGEPIAQLLRHQGPPPAVPHRQRRTAHQCRPDHEPHSPRTGDTPRRTARTALLLLTGEDFHRGAHL